MRGKATTDRERSQTRQTTRQNQRSPPKHREERNRTRETTRRTDRSTKKRDQEPSRATHQGDHKTTKGTEDGKYNEENMRKVLSWVSFDLPEHLKTTLSALLVAAGEGTLSYKQYPLSDGTFGMVSLIRKLNYLHQEDPMMREDCWFTTYWRNSCVVFHYVPSSSYWTWCFRN